jgi:hypothetical protein
VRTKISAYPFGHHTTSKKSLMSTDDDELPGTCKTCCSVVVESVSCVHTGQLVPLVHNGTLLLPSTDTDSRVHDGIQMCTCDFHIAEFYHMAFHMVGNCHHSTAT